MCRLVSLAIFLSCVNKYSKDMSLHKLSKEQEPHLGGDEVVTIGVVSMGNLW
jgi:hypothetical protein